MISTIKKLIFLTLGADLIASLLFIFSLQLNLLPIIICFYGIAMILLISSLLACYNNFKQYKIKILLFIIMINIMLLILFSMVMYSLI